jgi:hypothetical protein
VKVLSYLEDGRTRLGFVNGAGMTLYTFDRDTVGSGKSVCNGPCATNWPPLMAAADAQPSGEWTVVKRDDGSSQWAYKGRPLTDHFRNFFESARDRVEPISDVFSHHRALSTCHLAGIAARLNRAITWDPNLETIPNDPQAQSFLARPYRKGFEIEQS